MLRKIIFLFLCSFSLFPTHAHFMSRIWPQKGLAANDIGTPSAKHRILIAGTGSPFRDTVLSRLVSRLASDSVYIHIVNLKNLEHQNSDEWNVILLVNMCIAWDYDHQVKKFLRNCSDRSKVITFTTSGDPEGCFSEKKRKKMPPIDGYSSASADEKIGPAVKALYRMVTGHLSN